MPRKLKVNAPIIYLSSKARKNWAKVMNEALEDKVVLIKVGTRYLQIKPVRLTIE